jgi:uncharacterized membrane protein
MALAPFHIYYSQEARPYALVSFLTAASFYFFKNKKWWRYFLISGLGLYSSYYFFFVLLSQSVYLFFGREIRAIKYLFLLFLVFLPWLPFFLTQINTGQAAIASLSGWAEMASLERIKAIPLTLVKFLLGRITIFNKPIYALVTLSLNVIFGGMILWQMRKKENALFSLWLGVPIVVAWLVSGVVPNYQPFRLLFTLPAFYILLAKGILGMKKVWFRYGMLTTTLAISFWSVILYYSNSYFQRENWRGVVKYLERQKNSLIALLPARVSDWPWQYYSSGSIRLITVEQGVKPIENVELRVKSDEKTIYYIRYLVSLFDPPEKIALWLDQNGFVKIGEVNFNQIPVWEYYRR